MFTDGEEWYLFVCHRATTHDLYCTPHSNPITQRFYSEADSKSCNVNVQNMKKGDDTEGHLMYTSSSFEEIEFIDLDTMFEYGQHVMKRVNLVLNPPCVYSVCAVCTLCTVCTVCTVCSPKRGCVFSLLFSGTTLWSKSPRPTRGHAIATCQKG